MKARLTRVFEWRVWHLYLMAAVASLVLLLFGGALVLGSLSLRNQSRRETARNAAVNRTQARALENLKRIQALEKPPSDEQLARAASNALRVCVADTACRRALRGSIRGARLRLSDLPSTSTDDTGTPAAPGGTTSPPSSGSSPSPGASGPGGGTSTPTPRRPSSPAPRRPAAPNRPAPPAPSTPAPARPSPAPPAQPTPANPIPAPRPPVPLPTTPPPPPVPAVPPVQVQVCTPAVQVNCQRTDGRLVGPGGSAADPSSNSGRGNQGDRVCDRVKAPCDVFPPGLIRLP
jgi:hypothetical protein